MCLYVNRDSFKIDIAQEDIVCYKVLKKQNEMLFAPYHRFVYEIGKEYKTRIEPRFHNEYCEVTKGFHSLLNKEDIKIEKVYMQNYLIIFNENQKYYCFRCIIPKGSRIVYGKYGSKNAIVSEAIKIVEEV